MPPFQWILTEPERHDKGTEEEAIRPTKDTKGMSPHLESRGGHNFIDPRTETLLQEVHASNADRWVISLETARGRRSRKGSTLSTTRTKSRLTSRPLLCHETMWLQ